MTTDQKGGWPLWSWLLLAGALYVIPCLFLLNNGDFYDGLSPRVQMFIDLVYWPVKQLFKVLGWLD